MVIENRILDLAWKTFEDLSGDQYHFVVLTSTGLIRRPDSGTEVAIGILQNAPVAGEAAVVRIAGVSKLVMNDAIGVGSFVKAEYVAAADAGKGQDASASLQYARGIVVEASSAEDDVGSALLLGPVPAITQAAWQRATVTTINTAAAVTFSAAQLLGGMILRDPNGAARADLLDTAENIVAAIAGCEVGSCFEFTIRNTADAAETITVTTNTGLTLSGTMTIAQNNSKRFLAVVTNIGSGTEAVTVYSLGTVVH